MHIRMRNNKFLAVRKSESDFGEHINRAESKFLYAVKFLPSFESVLKEQNLMAYMLN